MPSKSPIDRFFDEILFPRMDEAFDMLAQRLMGDDVSNDPPRIHARHHTTKKKRVHKADETARRHTQRPATEITYYTIFEVSPHASVEVISAAHRVLVKKYHPDTAGASGEAKIRLINAAWEILQDPVKRRAYDRSIGLR
jgi:DnaJ-domain-containing protein 1